MFCKNCGSPQPEATRFCTNCGTDIAPPPTPETGAHTPVETAAPTEAAIIAEATTQPENIAAPPIPNIEQPPESITEPPVTNIQQQPESIAEPITAPPQPPAYAVQSDIPSGYTSAADTYSAPQDSPINAQPPEPPYANFSVPPEYAVAPPVYGAQPAVAQGPDADPTKRRSKKILSLVGGLLVLLAGIGVAVYFIFFNGAATPQKKVENAFEKTFNVLAEERDSASLQLGISTVLTRLKEVPSTTEVQIGISSASGNALPPFSFNISSHSDPDANKTKAEIALQYAGETALSLQLQRSGDVVSLMLPQLFDGALGIDMATLADDLKNSELGNMDDDVYALLESFAAAIESAASGVTNQDEGYSPVSEATTAQLDELYAKMWNSSKSSKGGSVSTEVNGFTKKADVFNITIPKAQLITFVGESAKTIMADDSFIEYMDMISSASGMYNTQEVQAAIDEIMDELSSILASDLSLVYYMEKDHIVKLEVSMDISSSPSQNAMDFMLVAEFGGEKNLSDAFSLSLGVPSQKTWLRFSAKGNHVPVDGVFSSAISFSMDNAGMNSTLAEIKVKYDSNASQDNFTATLEVPAAFQRPLIQLTGTVNIDVPKSSLSFALSRFVISDGYSETDLILSLKAYESEALTFPTPSPAMLFQMSENELEALLEDIQMNARTLLEIFN